LLVSGTVPGTVQAVSMPDEKIAVRSHFDPLATFNKLAAHETMIVFRFANLKAP